MTDIRIEKVNEELHPFQEDINVSNFFPGGQRREVLEEIIGAVYREIPIVILTGEEGSGKTMLCRVLEERLANEFGVVIFPHTVESFDDVVRKIALRFGVEVDGQPDRKNTEKYLLQIIDYLITAEKPVLIIFDEAENLYLATLERIRKMLDRITSGGARLQLMFAGRKTFLENNEQLSICDFKNSEDIHLSLPSLEDEEAYEYLESGLDKLEREGTSTGHVLEQLPSIVEMAAGNFSRLNSFTREVLDSDGDDASFMVLLDNVSEDKSAVRPKPDLLKKIKSIELPSDFRRYLPYTVAGLFLVLAAALLFPSGEEEIVSVPETVVEQIESLPAESLDSQGDVQGEVVTEQQPEQTDIPPAENAGTSIKNTGTPSKIAVTPMEEIGGSEETVDEPPEETVAQVEAQTEAVVETADLEQQDEPVKEVLKPSKADTKIVVLTAAESLKRKPANAVEEEETAVEGSTMTEVEEVIAANAHFTVEQLYQKRIQAGVDWKVGERNDMYTVQLMVLTSKTSEQNLKKMLSTDEYRQEAGNFFVFKKRSAPDVIFVFYGEYPTMSFARLAKNSLPQFLQKHKPYAISIKGAMAKVNR